MGEEDDTGRPATLTRTAIGELSDTVPTNANAAKEPASNAPTTTDIIEPIIARLRDRATSNAVPTDHRRSSAHQQPQRDEEHSARRHAAEVGRRLFERGWAWDRIAEWLQIAGRTLRHWCLNLLDRKRSACPLGRPVLRSPRDERNEVIHFLDEFGPQIGVPTLRECFPALSRAELDDLVKRYRRVWRERHREPLHILRWPIAGRVWAVDFAEPPTPIDGVHGYLLAVRDLATGMPLLWQPCAAATAANAAGALAGLFVEHGPPLVLKSDNGSHFTGGDFSDLLAAHRVEHLLSPPHWPRFHGAVEAGIHALKDRTSARAARAGHRP